MKKIKLFFILFFFVNIVFSQKFNSAILNMSRKSLELSEPSIINVKDNYGLKPVSNNKSNFLKEEFFPIYDKHLIYFNEYYIVNKTPSTESFYSYNNISKSFDLPAAKIDGVKGINLAYWGIVPSKDVISISVKPSDAKSANVYTLIKDILCENPFYFSGCYNIDNLFLLVVPVYPEASYIHDYLNRELSEVLSDNIYILWDKSKEPEKPDFIKNRYFKAIKIDVSLKLKPDLVEINFDNPEISVRYKIEKNSNPDSTFKTFNSSTNKLKIVSAQTSLDKINKIIIQKPFGYNIVKCGDSDTSQYQSGTITIDLSTSSVNNFKIVKLPPFNLFYIETSGTTNFVALIKYIESTLVDIKDYPYYMYLSHLPKSYTASRGDDYLDICEKIPSMKIQLPTFNSDLKKINSNISLELISKRTIINFNFFVSENLCLNAKDYFSNNIIFDKLNSKNLIKNVFLEKNLDEHYKIKDIKYFNINNL